jgi:signal transduction histidine kinase
MDSGLSAALLQLADAVGTASTLHDIYAAALAGLRDVTGIDRASILLFDADGVMRFKAWSGISDRYRAAVEGHTPWKAGQPATTPITVDDVAADPSLRAYGSAFTDEGIAALAFIPIVSRRQIIGKFMLYRGERGPFAPEVLGAALAIGHQIGFAVEHTRSEAEVAQALQKEAQVRERLTVLTRGSQKLLTSLDAGTVVARVIDLARQVVTADGYAVWLKEGETWRIAASHSLSVEFAALRSVNEPAIRFDEPVIAEDVQGPAMLEPRREAYRRERITSLMSIPLTVRQEPAGSIVFYYRTRHRPTDTELQVAAALGQMSAAAISNAQLYAEQQALRRTAQLAEVRAVFLAEASVLLSSLNYENNLQRLAELAVPTMADWCAVDLLDDGRLARLAVAHTDPAKVTFAHDIARQYPTSLDEPGGLGEVLRTGEPQLYRSITDAMLVGAARDDRHLEMLRALGLESAMLVPLATSGRVFGVMTFVSSTTAHLFDDADLSFAMDLARRAALAIENARLYREVNDANRVKDEFLATLSHELRTPLNVIVGRSRMLADERVTPEVRPSMETIERNANALGRLVEDLLDVSRFSLGQVALDLQLVQLGAIASVVAGGLEPTARAKSIQLVALVPASLPLLLGDSTRLQQVVWNLLSNAIKFTPSGGRVELALSHTPTHVVVTVTDTGEGIAAEFLPHVFETFRQGESTQNRRHGGLGLGLSIVRRLVELHGGTVAADSRGPGLGSTFHVSLPVSAVGAAVPAMLHSSAQHANNV